MEKQRPLIVDCVVVPIIGTIVSIFTMGAVSLAYDRFKTWK